MSKPTVHVLTGPTASGKTALSIRIAEHLPITVISADSRQVYRHLDIGTAKPSREQLDQVPHKLIDILEPDEPYSAGRFGEDAVREVHEVIDQGRIPLVVGGSGLYIKALTEGIASLPEKDEEVRSKLEDRLKGEGEEALRAELRSVDPRTEQGIEAGKPRRVVRALEVFYLTGEPMSVHHDRQTRERPFSIQLYGLSVPRDQLYARINARTHQMIEAGLVDETRRVLDGGVEPSAQSLNTVGYKEVIAYLEQEITRERMIELIQQSTRRFAKRQYTWFRGEEEMQWIDAPDDRPREEIAEELLGRFERKV